MATDELAQYYARRAKEYDRIYEKPERREALEELEAWIRDWARGEDVLELACGTGYWTQFLATAADTVLATDVNSEVLEVARCRRVPDAGAQVPLHEVVRFERTDAWAPPHERDRFTQVVAGFWVSHLTRSDLPRFLDTLALRLPGSGSVVLFDNRYVEGSSTKISRTDDASNTFQARALESGETFEVLKNFFTQADWDQVLSERAERVDYRENEYFWAVRYEVRKHA